MSEINLSLVPKFVDNMLSPVAKEAGEALADIIRIARIPLSSYLKKNNVKLEAALNKLKKELEEIPDENIVIPKASIVGPAFEELFKYYLEEEHIVEAFSKLIATSMDKEKSNIVHPQLFFAVKQMSSLDSKVFKAIFDEKYPQLYTIQPYAVFYMTGMPFPSYANYDIVLLPSNELINDDVTLLIKAYDSLNYLSNLGLIRQSVDVKYDTESDEYFSSDIYNRLGVLMEKVIKETGSSICLQKNITIHSWRLTNAGIHLANILGLKSQALNNR